MGSIFNKEKIFPKNPPKYNETKLDSPAPKYDEKDYDLDDRHRKGNDGHCVKCGVRVYGINLPYFVETSDDALVGIPSDIFDCLKMLNVCTNEKNDYKLLLSEKKWNEIRAFKTFQTDIHKCSPIQDDFVHCTDENHNKVILTKQQATNFKPLIDWNKNCIHSFLARLILVK